MDTLVFSSSSSSSGGVECAAAKYFFVFAHPRVVPTSGENSEAQPNLKQQQ